MVQHGATLLGHQHLGWLAGKTARGNRLAYEDKRKRRTCTDVELVSTESGLARVLHRPDPFQPVSVAPLNEGDRLIRGPREHLGPTLEAFQIRIRPLTRIRCDGC